MDVNPAKAEIGKIETQFRIMSVKNAAYSPSLRTLQTASSNPVMSGGGFQDVRSAVSVQGDGVRINPTPPCNLSDVFNHRSSANRRWDRPYPITLDRISSHPKMKPEEGSMKWF
jgi:hypothetical protein